MCGEPVVVVMFSSIVFIFIALRDEKLTVYANRSPKHNPLRSNISSKDNETPSRFLDRFSQQSYRLRYDDSTSQENNSFPLAEFLRAPDNKMGSLSAGVFPDIKFSDSIIGLLCRSKKTECCSCEEGCMRTRTCCIDKVLG